MESFVPLGGFFSMPPETRSPLSNARQYGVRCPLCNEKYEQEVAALSDGGVVCASVAQQYQSNLPSWLCSADPAFQSGSPSIKVCVTTKITFFFFFKLLFYHAPKKYVQFILNSVSLQHD